MTVTANTTRNDYLAGNNQNVYNYTFQLNDAADVTVILNGVIQTLNVHYTVQNVGVGTGGTITFTLVDSNNSPIFPTQGQQINILMTMELDRDTSYQPNGAFLASDVNNDYDRLWLAENQQQTAINRSLRLQDKDATSGSMELPLKASRLNRMLAFDSVTGEPIAGPDITSVTEGLTLSATLINGNTTNGNDVIFNDNDKAKFGTGSDLEIYHDGNNSVIKDSGTGILKYTSNNSTFAGVVFEIENTDPTNVSGSFIHFKDSSDVTPSKIGSYAGAFYILNNADERMLTTTYSGAVELYHSDDIKLSTTTSGVDVTGVVTATGGNSTNWNTAYTYSQIGHLPLTGGTLTGALSSNSNIETTLDMKARILYSSATNNTYLDLGSDSVSADLNASGAVNLAIGGATIFQARSTGVLINSGGLMMGGSLTEVIDSSRNLTNIGTISSGDITSTGIDVTGTVKFDGLEGTNSVNVTQVLDEASMASNSATSLSTQQSIKSYVDTAIAGVPQGDITGVTAGTNLSGGGTSGAVTLNLDNNISLQNITLTGYLRGPSNFTIDPAAHGDDTGTLVVAGNLQVDGTTTTINSTTVEIADLNFKVAKDATSNAEANTGGFTVGGSNAELKYLSSGDKWTMNKTLSFADSLKTTYGDNGDLEIYHDGNNSIIKDSGDGILRYTSNNSTSQGVVFEVENTDNTNVSGSFIHFKDSLGITPAKIGALANEMYLMRGSNNDRILATNNSAVELYHSDAKKFETYADGIEISDNAKFPVNGKAIFNDNFEIYRDASNSIISETGTGSLILRGTNLSLQSDDNDQYLQAIENGGVTLYHQSGGNSAPKLATTSTGIDVTGEITADGLALGDNDKAKFGAGDDLQIYHDGTRSYIDDTGTGSLWLRGGDVAIKSTVSETMADFANNGAVNLYYDNSPKIATTATGIDVTGTATMDGLTVDGTLASPPIVSISNTGGTWAAGDEIGRLQFYTTDGSGSGAREMASIRAVTNQGGTTTDGTLEFWTSPYNTVAKKSMEIDGVTGDISFYEDTGTTAKFFWDASAESLGINTSSPAFPLDISGDRARIAGGTTTTFAGLEVENSNGFGTIFGTGGSERTDLLDNRGFISAQSATSGLALGTEGADPVVFYTGGTTLERMRIDSSGRVGIGTSPLYKFHVQMPSDGSVGTAFRYIGATNNPGLFLSVNESTRDVVLNASGSTSANLVFSTTDERMRIDSSGNLLVGTTTTDIADATTATGIVLNNGGWYEGSRNGGTVGYFNRLSNDGEIVNFRKDGTTVGSIGTEGGRLQIGKGASGIYFYDSGPSVLPWNIGSNTGADNSIDLGSSGARFKDLYLSNKAYIGSGSLFDTGGDISLNQGSHGIRINDAASAISPTNGGGSNSDATTDLGVSNIRFKDIYRSGSTYQSSDRTLKQDIRDLTDAERNVAVACKGLLKAFRFIDAVEKEGDDACIHFGVIAQELAEAFEAEGLDANDYQVYKSATTTDEEGNEQTRLNVCYENLLAFIISAI
jgi:hypothetical protein